MAGPLSGYRVVELAGVGPAPFAAMLLSDMGAEVVRVSRPPSPGEGAGEPRSQLDLLARGRRSIVADLRHPDAVEMVLRLVEGSDVFLEGFRPGVTERLGLGPEPCLARNPRLVYARMTGWGQDGPLADRAGHDLNYIAVAGALHHLGRAGQPPTPPANLLGDFGGGGMLVAFGIVCALLEAAGSGTGQVVDAAMVDGAALLTTQLHSFSAMGIWGSERGTNLFDSGAHFYETYECADGGWLAIAPFERKFYDELRRELGLTDPRWDAQLDPGAWPELKAELQAIFRAAPLEEWCRRFEGIDACVAPVLSMAEAAEHPHNRARGVFVDVAGVTQPAPAPRFSRTPGTVQSPPRRPGDDTDDVLASFGYGAAEIAALRASGAVR